MSIPKNKVDRAVREDEAHAEVLDSRRQIRVQQIRAARKILTVDRSAAFVYFSCASVNEYGVRFGYSEDEARSLALVGAALEVVPLLEERLLEGHLTFDAAAVVAKIILHPELGKAAGEWLALAESADLRELRRKVRHALEEADRKETVNPKTFFLTEKDETDFVDARNLVMKKLAKFLTEGEAVGFLSRFYLDQVDPLRAKPGTRRMPDTRVVPSRNIPAEVERTVRNRTRGKCAVWGCRNRKYVQFAHLFPHCEGGSCEADGLLLLCPAHHQLYDAHLLIIEGTAEHPIFKDVKGNLLPGGPGPPAGG